MTDERCICDHRGDASTSHGMRHDAECPYATPVPASWRRYGG